MKLKSAIFLILGLVIGWITVPFLNADSESNTYKALLRRMIDIVVQIQINTKQTADNTKAIKETLEAK
jgi:hypothetical protein